MKIVATSDIHGQLPDAPCPEGDVLVLAGDICPDLRPIEQQGDWLDVTFRRWLGEQPIKTVLATWGNHDFIGVKGGYPDLPWRLGVDQTISVNEVDFYLSPHVPKLFRWAFGYPGDVPKRLRDLIPVSTDVLVSHGPPASILDQILEGPHVGSETLKDRLDRVQPKIVICGHIHEARGVYQNIYNVSSVDRKYQPYPDRFTVIEIDT